MNNPTDSAYLARRLQLCLPNLAIFDRPEIRLAELGLDSMDTVELLCVIHEEFGIRLTECDFHPAQTVGGLLAAIAAQLQPALVQP
jgi:acyl carrier protein